MPISVDIDRLNEQELVELNHQVVERLRFLREARAHYTMLAFRIGERVRFTPPNRPPVIGILTRLNRKSVTVISEGGVQWNVAPNFLERLNDDGTVERVTVEVRPK